MPLAPGNIINGRYKIIRTLGEGGFATVYQAEDSELRRVVAVKILKIASLQSEKDLERFQREARILARAEHPNIVTIYSFEIMDDTVPCIVMEYLEGCSLATYLAKNTKIEPSSVDIFLQISNGLAYAHRLGLVHRDLTPNNIFVIGQAPAFSVKIIDFGLSKLISDVASDKLTQTGAIVGTPRYMSPELARGQVVDNRSDIYAFGCVMYEALTGVPPLESDSPLGLIHLQQYEYPKEPEFTLADKAKENTLKQIILRCLQKDPALRFSSCDDLSAALMFEKDPSELAKSQGKTTGLHSWHGQTLAAAPNWYGVGISVLVLVLLGVTIAVTQDYLWQLGASIFIQSKSSLLLVQEQSFGQFLMHKNKYSTAIKIYSDLLERYEKEHRIEEFLSANIDLAHCYFEQGHIDEAFKLLLRTIDLPWITANQKSVLSFIPCCNALTDLYDRGGRVSKIELSLRAEILEKLVNDKRSKPALCRKAELKLLGRYRDYSRSLSSRELVRWQKGTDPTKEKIINVVAKVISTPHFIFDQEQFGLLGDAGMEGNILIVQAELNNSTIPETKRQSQQLFYYEQIYGSNPKLLKQHLLQFMASAGAYQADALEAMARSDIAAGNLADALDEARKAKAFQIATRIIPGIERAEVLEVRILVAKGDLALAKKRRQSMFAELDLIQKSMHPETDKEVFQTGRGNRRLELKTIQTAMSRFIDASVEVGAFKEAVNTWSELIEFERRNQIEASDKFGQVLELEERVKALKPADPELLKAVVALADEMGAQK